MFIIQEITDLVVKDMQEVKGIHIVTQNGIHIQTNGAKVFPSRKWLDTFKGHLKKILTSNQ